MTAYRAIRRSVLDWQRRAACQGASPDLFITQGERNDEPHLPDPAAAAYCNRCPVEYECLEYALEHIDWVVGVWGGTTTYQRRKMMRTINRGRCTKCGSVRLETTEDGKQVCIACGSSWAIT